MARKSRTPDFDQILDTLRAHGFSVTPFTGAQGGILVFKHGAGAVLVPGKDAAVASGSAPAR